MTHDFRAVPFAIGVWLSAAVVQIAVLGNDPVYWLMVATVCAFAVVVRVKLPLFVVGIALGACVAGIRASPLVHGPLHTSAQERTRIDAVGRVLTDPIVINRRNALDWTTDGTVMVRVSAFGLPLDVFTRNSSVEWGQTVRVVGRLAPARAGRASAATVNATVVTVMKPAPFYVHWAQPARSALHRALRYTPEYARALIPGLALGDTSQQSASLNAEMRASGLSHLTAVSGANVALVVAGVAAIVRRRRARLIATLVCVSAFVVLVRPQPSVLRAAVMAGIAAYALVIHRKASVVPALCAAVVLLVCTDPFLATSYGFALSVAATAGLVLVPHEPSSAIGRAIVVTTAAQLAVLPLTVALGSPVTLASIPANLIAVPMAAPAMMCGLVVCVVGVVWPSLAGVLAWMCVAPSWVIATIAHIAAHMEAAVVPWPHSPAGIASAVAVTALVGRHALMWHSRNNLERAWSIASVMVLLAAVIAPPRVFEGPWPPEGWRMVQCDVGQGDATVLRVAKHSAIVVDAGGEPSAVDRCLSSLRVSSVPLLVLTHFHADHVGGIEGVFHHRTVGQVLVSPLNDPPAMQQFVRGILRAHHIDPQVMSFPGRIEVNGITLRCLWPMRLIEGEGSAANNASVVLRTEIDGVTYLLTGDVEPPAQEAMLAVVSQADVVKIAHHGSAHQSPQFATRVHPRIATISVGAHNDYGHPAQSTIAMYEATGATVLRTDQVGDIAIVWRAGKLVAFGRHT